MLGNRERIATGGLCLLREKSEGDPGRCTPFRAPSEGGLTAGDLERVNVLRSYSLDGLLRLELLDSDWPLPCLTRNAPFVLASFLCVPIFR